MLSKKENVEVPNASLSVSSVAADNEHLKEAILAENCWLKHAIELLSKSEAEKCDIIAWAAYHASQCSSTSCTTITQLMPLFYGDEHDKKWLSV